jgi:hypothetical protein
MSSTRVSIEPTRRFPGWVAIVYLRQKGVERLYQVFFGPQKSGVCENADIYASLLVKGKVE